MELVQRFGETVSTEAALSRWSVESCGDLDMFDGLAVTRARSSLRVRRREPGGSWATVPHLIGDRRHLVRSAVRTIHEQDRRSTNVMNRTPSEAAPAQQPLAAAPNCPPLQFQRKLNCNNLGDPSGKLRAASST